MEGSPKLVLELNSSIVVIDTLELGTSRTKSYFYIKYKNERYSGIPWDASSNLVKASIEGLSTILGNVYVSRSTSLVSMVQGGFRWAIRLEGLIDETSQLGIETAKDVYYGHKAISIQSLLLYISTPIHDWQVDNGDKEMCTGRYAAYKNGTGTEKLVFVYTVLKGDSTDRLDVSTLTRDIIKLTSKADKLSNSINSGESSLLDAILSQQNITLHPEVKVKLDTSAPIVQNVTKQNNTLNHQTYATGDSIYFDILFNKAVIVRDGLDLVLNVGSNRSLAWLYSGSKLDTLTLKYTVLEGQESLHLDYLGPDALVVRNLESGFVRRDSDQPVTYANLTLPWYADVSPEGTLEFVSQIAIDGIKPKIYSVSFDKGQNGKLFREHENIYFIVKFSSNVLVVKQFPVLVIIINGISRSALYSTGSGTNELKFKYTVLVGDTSPPALVCKMISVLSDGHIFHLSSNSINSVDLTLPHKDHGKVKYFLL